MKIALISSYGVYCGIARYTYHLAEEFLKRRQDVRIFARYKGEKEVYERGLEKLPLKVVRCWLSEEGSSLQKLFKELLKFQPDIVHIQDIFRREEGIKKIHKLFPGRVIMTFHSVEAPKVLWYGIKKISDKEFVRRTKNYIDYFIVHNLLSKKKLIQESNIRENEISVVHHGTLGCRKIKKKDAREKIGLPKRATLILTYGFFSPRKGIEESIKIMPKLIKNIPTLNYIHVGRKRLFGKDKFLEAFKNLKTKIKNLSLKERVKFIWKYFSEKDVEIYLRAADLILLFYQEEYPLLHSSGIAHQVISSGRPIIATDITTFSEFPKNAMYKIPVKKSALLKAIIKILKDKKLQKKLIKNALHYSKATSWKNTAKRHLKLYSKITK